MTNQEAWNRIDAIIARHEIDDDYVTITSFLDYDALRMARKALEQEPSGDLISRQTVIDACEQSINILEAVDRIMDLPSVKQEPTPNEVLDKIRAEIKKPLEIEKYADTDSAKAQAIALNWCIEIIDKYRKKQNDKRRSNRIPKHFIYGICSIS